MCCAVIVISGRAVPGRSTAVRFDVTNPLSGRPGFSGAFMCPGGPSILLDSREMCSARADAGFLGVATGQNNVVFGDELTGGEAGAQGGELFRALCRA